ncbi:MULTISPECIES: hypothetical protein [unclassified Burkholderia]|uniref:hypothetical protein n=1 Tax=unclassified Burkholderia TaxID=2613784 RepID=UPI00075A3C33|nr:MULTISPECIES: hypothetical protein [unclassified Burkholderia]AOI75511.1 hypothetical protein WS54_04055 [Burkholderia sp. NRF60-BP8]KVA07690.1 hypothetical protein WS54_26550 [Burkholderia sp. NRF60-BP8]KVH55974.1 hypothetical protein WS89_25010 [Burkholderia sp. MSMB1072]KVL14153.1 hypothetical protein WS95_23880 [Burkholderia sp. MSMB1826]KVL25127.1 hypothetical protein WS96_30210 [Burkholderia sp. MSMB1835]
MNLPNPFFNEVVDTHVDIERWLSGRAEPGRLAMLMARFSPGFSMITTSGTVLDYAGVDALFSRGHGARPGLVIGIDELRALAVWSDGAVIGYRETQTDMEGRRTVRRSTALFRREADGVIVWRHLHETPVAA